MTNDASPKPLGPKQDKPSGQQKDQPLALFDWQSNLKQLAYAYSKPLVSGVIKSQPEHFSVTEVMDFTASGEGEHTWLDITKTRCNTDRLAKSLAQFAGVAYRDVGYSGMKDFQAVTRQWFSVWKPRGDVPDWSQFSMDGVVVNQYAKHNRKIKRGTHRSNKFEIRITQLEGDSVQPELEQRLAQIAQEGVPNYFGEQRFGREARNMPQSLAMLSGEKRIKDRSLRSILLSSARSWLFNELVSARVKAETWQQLFNGEPANLNGTNSNFISTGSEQDRLRLCQNDIHPTAAMWGQGSEGMVQSCPELAAFEAGVLSPFSELQRGLENARVDYQRRAIRCLPSSLEWLWSDSDLVVCFELSRGQFATSVLRELVCEK